jgi:hypothetical protein
VRLAALALAGFVVRVLAATAIALLLALLFSLVRDGTSFRGDLAVGCLVVGCLLLLMAPAGSSPAMRMGTIDPLTASFFPKLIPRMGEEYAGTRVSSSALFFLAGAALIAASVVLHGSPRP